MCSIRKHCYDEDKYEPLEFSKIIYDSEKSSTDQEVSDDSNKPPKEIVGSNDNAFVEAETDQGELMRWHLRLGHLSCRKIQLLAALGVITKKLLRAKVPKRSACLHG